MKRALGILSLVFISSAVAATLPLTVKELSLMLRSGYSVQAVETELGARHFADTIDEAKRKQLLDSGATTQLLDEIQAGKFNAPKEELDKARRKIEESQERALATAAPSRKVPASTQRSVAPRNVGVDVIANAGRGNLVRVANGSLVSYYDQELDQKKIYGLYFGAHWCAPCRKFTPQLIQWYNQIARDHPEFEIIFISNDKSLEAMTGYMTGTGMPWPAVDFAKVAMVPSLLKYAGTGIPDLVVVDSSGKVLADSFVNGKYVGPAQVLAQLDGILSGARPRVAENR